MVKNTVIDNTLEKDKTKVGIKCDVIIVKSACEAGIDNAGMVFANIIYKSNSTYEI